MTINAWGALAFSCGASAYLGVLYLNRNTIKPLAMLSAVLCAAGIVGVLAAQLQGLSALGMDKCSPMSATATCATTCPVLWSNFRTYFYMDVLWLISAIPSWCLASAFAFCLTDFHEVEIRDLKIPGDKANP